MTVGCSLVATGPPRRRHWNPFSSPSTCYLCPRTTVTLVPSLYRSKPGHSACFLSSTSLAAVRVTLNVIRQGRLASIGKVGDQRLMKRRSVLTAYATLALFFIAISVAAIYARNNERSRDAAFRSIGDTFAIHESQGWTLTSAPTDGRRYRMIGATQSNPKGGESSLRGSFKTRDRSVDFVVEVPNGRLIAIEGLEPIDGGPLTYAVLARDLRD